MATRIGRRKLRRENRQLRRELRNSPRRLGGGSRSGSYTRSRPVSPSFSQGDLESIARADVNASLRPTVASINQAMNEAKAQYEDDAARVQGVYQGLQNQLAPIYQQYNANVAGIAPALSSQLQSYAPAFGLGAAVGPNPDSAQGTAPIANQAFGSVGAGALGLLAADRQGVADWQASVGRQGAIEGVESGRKYLADLQDRLNQLEQERIDATAGTQGDVLSRLADLRNQAFANRMDSARFAAERGDVRYGRRQDRRESELLKEFLASQAKGMRRKAEAKKAPAESKTQPSPAEARQNYSRGAAQREQVQRRQGLKEYAAKYFDGNVAEARASLEKTASGKFNPGAVESLIGKAQDWDGLVGTIKRLHASGTTRQEIGHALMRAFPDGFQQFVFTTDGLALRPPVINGRPQGEPQRFMSWGDLFSKMGV